MTITEEARLRSGGVKLYQSNFVVRDLTNYFSGSSLDLVGRANGAMISGKVYDVLKNIEGIEDRLHTSFGYRVPSILLRDVEVSGS